MKAETLRKRLESRYNGPKNCKEYQIVSDVINDTNKSYTYYNGIIRPCYTSGSGRFTKNMDHTKDVKELLNLIGVKFESGNDSPRGGQTGNYIKILTKITY